MAGLTQAQLMMASKVDKATIHSWESGRNALHWEWKKHRDAIKSICLALNIPESAIWQDAPVEQATVAPTPANSRVPVVGIIPCQGSGPFEETRLFERSGLIRAEAADEFAPTPLSTVSRFVRVAGDSMAPRIKHGDLLGIVDTSEPVDGVIHLVYSRGRAQCMGLKLLAEEREAFPVGCRGQSQPFDGQVLGLVVYIHRVTGPSAYIDEVDPMGILVGEASSRGLFA
jgi:transcriptional regulator with XRE-family HTH domain